MKVHPATRRATVLRVLLVLCGLGTLCVGLVAFMVYRTLTVGGDLRAARNVVTRDLDLNLARQVQISAHPWLVGLARFGLSFAPLEPEAQLALKAVRGAEVGVYALTATPDARQRSTLFNQVDARLTKRGWHRLVAVSGDGNLVMVYGPDAERDADELEVFVLVLDGRDLVMVSGAGNLAPLVQLAEGHLPADLPAFANWRR